MEGFKTAVANLFPFIVMILIFYLLLIKPQQKQMKERKKMLESVKVGDRVITNSGMYGTISAINGEEMEVKISENVKVKMIKSAVQNIVTAK